MQKGLVSYKLMSEGWDVSDHFGDGCDLVAEKDCRFIKIELKAIDLRSIKKGNNATQHLSANEIVTASHLIITVFNGIEMKDSYIMNMRQFVENSGVRKYEKYSGFGEFIKEYKAELPRSTVAADLITKACRLLPSRTTALTLRYSADPHVAGYGVTPM